MPWFRVDDTFAHHTKVMAAGNAAGVALSRQLILGS